MKSLLFKPDIWVAKKKVLDEYGLAVTRRVGGLKEINQEPDRWVCKGAPYGIWQFDNKITGERITVRSKYQVGDVVYIKEAHYAYGHWTQFYESGKSHWEFFRDKSMAIQFADLEWKHAFTKPSTKEGWYKRSPLFLEAEFARDFIKITDVGAERLREITAVDIVREGIPVSMEEYPWSQFRNLWNSINKDYQWESNPWVFRYAFCKEGKK